MTFISKQVRLLVETVTIMKGLIYNKGGSEEEKGRARSVMFSVTKQFVRINVTKQEKTVKHICIVTLIR